MITVERVLPRVTNPAKHVSNFIQVDEESVRKKLQEIRETTFSVDSDFTTVNHLLNSLGSVPLTIGMLQPGALIMRARCGLTSLHETTKAIKTQADISYRRDYKNVSLGRANLVNEPIFYGCIANHDKNNKHAFAHAASACFLEAKDKEAIKQTMTAGIWRINKPISFAILMQRAHLTKSNSLVRQSLLPIQKLIRGDNRTTEASLLVADYFSELYSQPVAKGEEHKYVVGACFATSLFLQGLDSIVYSSIATAGTVPNIAILPEVVDQSLELISVRAMSIQRTSPSSYVELKSYTCHPSNHRSFKAQEAFDWHLS